MSDNNDNLDGILRDGLKADDGSEQRVLTGLHRALIDERARQERQQVWSKAMAAGVALLVGGGLLALLVLTNPSRGAQLAEKKKPAEKPAPSAFAAALADETAIADDETPTVGNEKTAELPEKVRREIDALIAQLASEEFDVRDGALQKLLEYGPRIEDYIHQKITAMKKGDDPEVHSALQGALQRLKRTRKEGVFKQALTDLAGNDPIAQETAAKNLLLQFKTVLKKGRSNYLNKIAAQLASDDPAARATAAKQLSEGLVALQNQGPEIEAALRAIGGEDEAARKHAISELAALLGYAVVERELAGLLDEFAGVEADGPVLIVKIKAFGAAAAPHLAAALADGRPTEVRRGAADALKAFGPLAREAASDLALLLDETDKEACKLAAECLLALGPLAAEAASDVADALESDDAEVRQMAAKILKQLGPAAADAASDVVLLLDDDDKEIRKLACEVLLSMGAGAAEAITDLTEYLTDDDKDVRASVLAILVKMGPAAHEAAEDLADIVADDANDASSRAGAAKALGAIGPQASGQLKTLARHADDANAEVKTAVTEAMAKIRGTSN